MNRTEDIRRTYLAALAEKPRKQVTIEGFIRAGVLVPLVFNDGKIELLFTKRTDSVETHKGQVSFPGGMVDASDADIVHTALRETQEEIGIEKSDVSVIGVLDDHPTPTQFIITPVVGILDAIPHTVLNPAEVAEVFRVPLEFFADETNARKERREFRGQTHDVWFYTAGPHVIWGATATIIRSLLNTLEPSVHARA